MKFEKIKDGVFFAGLKDKERRLFDQLVPLPEGTTYNSYIVEGKDKIAIIDTMYPKKTDEYIKNLEENGIEKVDYIIANHGEQDHSGSLPKLIEKYPMAQIISNAKCKEIIKEMLLLPDEKITVIQDKDEIDLGGKTLQFIFAPWVHWPDTMFTYIKEDKLLCTCDFLGAHYTTGGMFADDSDELKVAAKRYYAEIIMPFRTFAAKHLKTVKEINPEMILPSHGPIYKNPEFIYNLYDEWTGSYLENSVLIPYVSMYESTEMMAKYLAKKLETAGIKPILFDTVSEDHGELAMLLVNVPTIILAASMVLAGPHPAMVTTAYLLSALRPKFKNLGIIGSFGWGGNLTGKLEDMFSLAKPHKFEYILTKGQPKEDTYAKLDELCNEIVSKHKELGLM
ncbi:MAG: FprA family A-type flavoprotein [Candidatus Gastranaerophilales bacterium]|nr:FprA family A-type flavoprotein [Candidatus Gastranaerophilales bacterium]